jgi:hypothetical protein
MFDRLSDRLNKLLPLIAFCALRISLLRLSSLHGQRLNVPDALSILLDAAVRGEETHA